MSQIGGLGSVQCDATVLKADPAAPQPTPVQASLHLRPCRYGPMIYFPHDFYIGGALERYGEYGEEEAQLLGAYVKEGDIVVEVGANIGCHTIPLAKRITNSGRLIAFEPQRILFQMMCGNLALNGIWNVVAEHCALGHSPGLLRVPPVDYMKDGNFGGVALQNGEVGDPVQVLPLDMFKLARCDVIKIDVEGMEMDVLTGATQTIGIHRPVLYVENDRQEKADALIAYIRGLNYAMYWHLPKLFNPNNFKNNTQNDYGEVVSVNMLCIPAEKSAQYEVPNLPLVGTVGGGVLQ